MSEAPRLEKLGRFLLRGLRIGASTVSIVELLRSDWTAGISAGVAWLVFLQVERRLPPLSPETEDGFVPRPSSLRALSCSDQLGEHVLHHLQ